jgi:hypothetical protein
VQWPTLGYCTQNSCATWWDDTNLKIFKSHWHARYACDAKIKSYKNTDAMRNQKKKSGMAHRKSKIYGRSSATWNMGIQAFVLRYHSPYSRKACPVTAGATINMWLQETSGQKEYQIQDRFCRSQSKAKSSNCVQRMIQYLSSDCWTMNNSECQKVRTRIDVVKESFARNSHKPSGPSTSLRTTLRSSTNTSPTSSDSCWNQQHPCFTSGRRQQRRYNQLLQSCNPHYIVRPNHCVKLYC